MRLNNQNGALCHKSLGLLGLFAVIWVKRDDLKMISTSLFLRTCCCVKNDVMFLTQVTACGALLKDIHSPWNRCKEHKWTDLSCSSEIPATHKVAPNNQECLALTWVTPNIKSCLQNGEDNISTASDTLLYPVKYPFCTFLTNVDWGRLFQGHTGKADAKRNSVQVKRTI